MKTEKILGQITSVESFKGTENCLAVGTWLNDFEITGILGEGGFGIVYLAFDHSLQRTVAIKEYMPGTLAGRAVDGSVAVRAERHKATFDAGLKSFINEARLLAQFDHPSLIKVYRFWEKNKTAYMAMRYYDGDTLKDIVKNRPELITEVWLKFIFKQILEALDTLYKAKILHRDVSPDNIIVQKNGDAVLLDFGSARQIIGDMTQGLTVILKPGYAPVEQYSDDEDLQQGPWTDIYALAAVMYFMILKTPPPMAVARIVKDSLVPLQDGKHPGFSEKFLMAVDKGLAIQPRDRPQSMDEFRRQLGISAFVSARHSRSGGAIHTAEILSDTDEVANVARIRNAPYTATLPSTQYGQQHRPAISKENRLRDIVIATGSGLILLAAIGIYFAKNNKNNKNINPQTQVNSPTKAIAPSILGVSGIVQEKSDWNKLDADSGTSLDALMAFLQQYPSGQFADAAHARIAQLDKVTSASKTASANAQENNKTNGNIKLSAKPWGTVFVDGVQSGASPPLKNLSLSQGRQKI
ncbi:MAG: serine/threonine protein kinase, partial [Cytophaga sp.]|nr:serine/threonine protein kinase [Undibacterium sp.]